MGIYYKGREMSSGTRVDGDTIQTNASGRIYVAKAPPAYKTYDETKAALVPDLSGDFATKQSVIDLQTSLKSDYAKKTELPGNATSEKPGLVGIGYQNDDVNRKYAVRLSGDHAYVHVPWTGGSAGDVAVDGVTIGKKSKSEGYAIYVKSIESLSGDLTSTMAKKADLPTKVSQLSNDSGYLTQHQSLEGYATENWVDGKYAKTTDLPERATDSKMGLIGVGYARDGQDKTYAVRLSGDHAYVRVPWTGGSAGDVVVDNVTIGQKGADEGYAIYVKSIESLSGDLTSTMAKKADLPTKTSQLTNDSGYITEHQSLAGYATELWVEGKGYLTQHQSLAGYAQKNEIPGTASVGKPGIIGIDYPDGGMDKNYPVKLSGDNAYVHVPWTGGSASDVAVDGVTIGKKGADENYAVYVKSVASLSGDLTATMATKAEIPIKVSELQNDSGYLTEHQSLVAYAKKADLPTKVSELQNDSGYLTEHQSLSDYAKKTDLPARATDSKMGLIGVGYPNDGVEKTYAVRLSGDHAYVRVPWTGGSAGDVVVDGVTIGQKGAESDYAIYVKSIASLSGDLTATMATKASVPTKVSQLTNDSGYLTEHQSLSEYAKKTELPVIASVGKPGIIGVDYPDDGAGKKYAVKVSGDNAYVHVPWTGGSASDVAVDDVTIGKKDAKEDHKIYVKNISSLSGDLTATMATRSFVNSSVATNTSYFRGTYATFGQLSAVSAYNNDYAFVSADSSSNLEFKRYKYLSNDISAQGWQYEYTLNNSSFTQEQWQAINSTIKKETVDKIILSDSVSASNWNSNYDKFKDVANLYTLSTMTQRQYDELGSYDPNTLYFTYDS